MIRYSLSCSAGHRFDSWFAGAAAFDALAASGHVSCPVCGETRVEKALMAPSVRTSAEAPSAHAPAGGTEGALRRPASEIEQALAALRRQVEENSEYVGVNFVTEARRMHDGEVPERAIYGEAKPDEARRLMEDGVPVAPLPFMPARKTN